MGKILLYAGGGYVVLVLLSSALVTGPSGLPLLTLAAIVFFLYRAGVLDKLLPQGNERVAVAGGAAVAAPAADRLLADALRYERRFDEARRLEAAFPEDPLENAALVSVLGAYLHEPPEERQSVEDEYRRQRERLLALMRKVQRLRSPHGLDTDGLRTWLQDAAELDAGLSAIEAYVAEIQTRAEATEELPQKALEHATRAGDLLATARTTAASAGAGRGSVHALSARLAEAETKHRESWNALKKGEERPLTALRLADEAAALAEDVRQDAARIAALPKDLERRLSELTTSIEQVQTDLARVESEFESAVESYAPSCWHEIGGVGHAARRAVARATRLRESAARRAESASAAELERAAREADEAGLAVADAARLGEAIERHLAKLETAAVDARAHVVGAEQEIDRAWSAVHDEAGGGNDEVLRRAAELVQQARAGLATAQPDWLTIVELADRGAALARNARVGRSSSTAEALASRRFALEHAKARAKEARDSAWAQAIVRPATAEAAPALLDATEDTYQAALGAEAAVTGASSPDGITAATAAFEEAERAANAFSRAVEGLEDAPAGQHQAGDVHVAHTLVWDLKVTRTTRF